MSPTPSITPSPLQIVHYMKQPIFLLLLIALLIITNAIASSSFNSLPWISNMDDAKAQAAINGKPLAVLFTAGFCGACRKLKKSFVPGPGLDQFEAIAANFNLVHIADAANLATEWTPDGGYIPRLIIADTDGQPMLHLHNGKAKYKYFPGGSVESFAERLRAIYTALR